VPPGHGKSWKINVEKEGHPVYAVDYAKEYGNRAARLHFQINESIIRRWVKAADKYFYAQ